MLKAAKKLKFWSKNKKRKKNNNPDAGYFPPPPCCCCTCSCSAIQPSAPPMPPWLDDRTPLSGAATGVEVAAPPSYQQYMAPNPVYGVAIMQMGSQRERSFFADLGLRLIGCLCPCLRIREVYHFQQQ